MTMADPLTAALERAPDAASAATPTDLAELIGAFNDVTSRLESTHVQLRAEVRRLNEELREKHEELQRSRRLAALGEMAAGIAHEIRNPLASIGLYARLLDADLGCRELPAGEELRGNAQKIAEGVRRLDAVVKDVLAFAREARVAPDRVPVVELFDGALAAVEAELRSGPRIEVIRQDRGHDAAAEVWCDATLTQQALVNLLANAAQALAEHGGERREIRTSARAVRGGGVALCVADTGPGMPREVVERMFNPFFTTRETGTGLGLAIVHRIVDAHGGRVVVRNSMRAGASGAAVELHLPGERSRRRGETGLSERPAETGSHATQEVEA